MDKSPTLILASSVRPAYPHHHGIFAKVDIPRDRLAMFQISDQLTNQSERSETNALRTLLAQTLALYGVRL